MRLTRVDVARLRGGREGFRIEGLGPGLNLVFGPNGSGKSSLCTALCATLWPDVGGATEAEFVAWWTADADAAGRAPTLRAELRAGGRSSPAHVEWQRDGAPVDPPRVPGRHLAPVYRLGLRDLLADDHDTDRQLANRIRIEMSGGFDVSALRRVPARRFGHAEESALRDAIRARARLEGERRRLAEDADRLEALHAQRDAAEAAQAALDVLAAAAEIARLRDEVAVLGEWLAALDAPRALLEALRGDERERLAALAKEREQAREACRSAARAMADLERERRALALPDPRPDPGTVELLEGLVATLRDAEAERRDGARRLDEARQVAEAAAGALAGDADRQALTRLGGEEIDRAAAFVGRAIAWEARRETLEGAIEAAGHARTDARAIAAEADAVRRRGDLLRDWLATPVPAPPASRWPHWITLVLGVAVGVFASLRLVPLPATTALPGVSALPPLPSLSPLPPWGAVLLLLAAGGAIGSAIARLLVPRDGRADVRAALEARFGELPPTGDADADGTCADLRFDPTGVREALARLDARLAALLREHDEAIALEEKQRALARVEDERDELAEDRAVLAERIGVDPGLGAVAFQDLIDRVRRYREAAAARVAREGELRELAGRVETLRGRLAEAMPQQASPGGRSADEWIAAAQSFCRACERDGALTEQLAQVVARRELAEGSAEWVEAQRAGILSRADLAPDCSDDDADVRLARLLEERAHYDEIRRRRRAASDRMVELERVLQDRPDLLDVERAEADARLAAARERAREVGEIAGEIARIEEQVRAAASSGALEAANAEVARAEADLAAARDALACELAADFLLEDVESEYERDTQPALLREASALLARFTGHRYRLEVTRREQGGGFRAIDTETGRGLSLAELSDGTRMQLLLAARLAFALHAESGQHPPIFLDEALTATDPDRFEAVANGLLELAAEGRQVFYMTCNPADVALFERIAAEAGASALPVFDLGRLRGRAAVFVDAESLEMAPRTPVPEPGDDTPEAYALRLGVPRPMRGEGVESLHLFHVLRDDLPTLHRLVAEARVERVGHWYSFRSSPALGGVLDARVQARVEAAVGVAERYLAAFAIGRGRPVDRAVLEETRAVTDRFIDAIDALAREVGGDAKALVEAIEARRVSRFHTSQLEKLREALESSGHLDPATSLDAEALRVRALAGVPADPDAAGGFDLAAAQRVVDWLERIFPARP